MSDREKKLGLVVGVLLVLVVGYVGYTYWAGRVDVLRRDQFTLESEISDQEAQVQRGDQALLQIEQFRARSLPADAEVARSAYKAWLLDLAEKQVQFDDPVVTPGTISRGATCRISGWPSWSAARGRWRN